MANRILKQVDKHILTITDATKSAKRIECNCGRFKYFKPEVPGQESRIKAEMEEHAKQANRLV
jgi:hypothetical protein